MDENTRHSESSSHNEGQSEQAASDTCSEEDILVYEYRKIERSDSAMSFVSDMSHWLPIKRPLAEPPIFGYDTFIDDDVPSDKRLEELFPDRRDIGKKTEFRDHGTEFWLLHMFMVWASDMALYEEESQEKLDLYNALTRTLSYEKRQVKEEYDRVYKEAPPGLGWMGICILGPGW